MLSACSEHLGYGSLSRDVWEPTFGMSMEENRSRWFPHSTQKEVDDFCNLHYSDYIAHLHILPGAADALNAVRKSLLGGSTDRMMICTNCPQPITEQIVANCPLLAEFFIPARTICSGTSRVLKESEMNNELRLLDLSTDEMKSLSTPGSSVDYILKAKPSADLIHFSASQLSIVDSAARHCVFIGDSQFDMMCAIKAGVFAIGVGSKGTGGNMQLENIGQLATKMLAGAKKPTERK